VKRLVGELESLLDDFEAQYAERAAAAGARRATPLPRPRVQTTEPAPPPKH